jgi:hypothetical protein
MEFGISYRKGMHGKECIRNSRYSTSKALPMKATRKRRKKYLRKSM